MEQKWGKGAAFVITVILIIHAFSCGYSGRGPHSIVFVRMWVNPFSVLYDFFYFSIIQSDIGYRRCKAAILYSF